MWPRGNFFVPFFIIIGVKGQVGWGGGGIDILRTRCYTPESLYKHGQEKKWTYFKRGIYNDNIRNIFSETLSLA